LAASLPKEVEKGVGSEKVALRSFRNFKAHTILKKRRDWLRKTTLLNIRNPFLFFNQIISNPRKKLSTPSVLLLPFSNPKEVKGEQGIALISFDKESYFRLAEKEKSSSFSILLMKKSALFAKKKREGLKEGSNLPPWIKILFENNQSSDLKSSLTSFSSPFASSKQLPSFPFPANGSLYSKGKEGASSRSLPPVLLPGGRERAGPLKGKGVSSPPASSFPLLHSMEGEEGKAPPSPKGKGSSKGRSNGKRLPLLSTPYPKGKIKDGMGGLAHLREGEALRASKAIALSIDAVFMPVNRVNYIIETNEQSVMLKNTSNINFASLASLTRSPSVLVTRKEQANSESKSGFNFKNLTTKKKTFLKSTAAHNLLLPVSKRESVSEKLEPLFPPMSSTKKDVHKNNHFFDLVYSRLRRKEEDNKRTRGFKGDYMRLSENETKTPLKNNIIIEVWTNGSIHPRQALYEACKNLLSLFSKLEKATPLAFPSRRMLDKV